MKGFQRTCIFVLKRQTANSIAPASLHCCRQESLIAERTHGAEDMLLGNRLEGCAGNAVHTSRPGTGSVSLVLKQWNMNRLAMSGANRATNLCSRGSSLLYQS